MVASVPSDARAPQTLAAHAPDASAEAVSAEKRRKLRREIFSFVIARQ
jgi:hypothetical protein